MAEFTFEQLPTAVNRLHERLDSIEKLLCKRGSSVEQDKDNLLTVPEAAKFLTLSISTIYGLIHKGEIPHMKRSKRVYFSRQELLDYLKQGKRKGNFEIEDGIDEYLRGKKIGSR